MRKKRLSRRQRLSILVILLAAVLAGAAATAYVFCLPVTVAEEIPILKYHHEAKIGYRVRLKSNAFYSSPVLEPGSPCLTAFVQGVEAQLTYRFTAEDQVRLKGTSGVTAVAQAFTRQGDKIWKVWERTYFLKPPQAFQLEGKTASLEERLWVDVEQYNRLVESLAQEAKVGFSEARLLLRWDLALEASSSKGAASDRLSPVLILPLNQTTFEAGGEPTAERSGAFTARQIVRLPMRENLRGGLPAGLAAGVILLLLFALGTEARQVSAAEAAMTSIQRRYGAFMAEVKEAEEETTADGVSLASIDDLVKVADELGKPVLYRRAGEEILFFVVDGRTRYAYRLALPPAGEGEETTSRTVTASRG